MTMHPLLHKYGLTQYAQAPQVPRGEVIGLCEQLEWTERELDRAKHSNPARYKRPRQWQTTKPNLKVAAHRSKPAGILAVCTGVLPFVEMVGGGEVSELGLAILLCAVLFGLGQYLIHLFFQSV